MKKAILIFTGCLILNVVLFSQDIRQRNSYEINAGFGMLIYQSAYNLQDSYGIEAAVSSKLAGPANWQAGFRVGMNPALPEIFGRILLSEESGPWRPEIGLEIGMTWRAEFEDGAMLLRETREAMQTDISCFYLAIHTAPLAFKIKENWKLSVLEIDFGTHFTNPGRTLRAQLTVISVGRKF